jgi:hypothetical protein
MSWKTVTAHATTALALLVSPQVVSAETYHWVQYAPDGLEARAVTDQPACPAARVDGAAATMVVRAAPGEGYPTTVCSLHLPAATASASVGDVPLALPVAEPKRIAVLGDTGCRLKGDYVQACNDPQAWPFRLIAEVVAHMKPDLVIHVGDYHYRETPCPEGNAGCAGSPYGDTWDVWRADFFAPADTLLRTAPWVFIRGNHEVCARGGKGWSRTLEPFPFDADKACNRIAAPFAVRLPGLTLAVMDVSAAREETVDEKQVPLYREHYGALAQLAGGTPTWLLQHRPIWSAGGTVGGKLVGDNKTLAAAATGLIPASVDLMLSGHHHLFQVLDYQTDLPAQIVSGHGGDTLNRGASDNPAGWVINGVTVKSGINVLGTFGFLLLEREGEGWRLTSYDKLGAALRSCSLKGRAASCPSG